MELEVVGSLARRSNRSSTGRRKVAFRCLRVSKPIAVLASLAAAFGFVGDK